MCACSGGSWGKSAIYNMADCDIILNTSTLRLRFYGDLANNIYLYYVTKTHLFKQQLAEQLSGMQPNFGYAHYSKLLIPIPPLNEQQRIANRIAKLECKVNDFRSRKEKINNLEVSIIPELKKSILQYAIQGNLVPQNSEDEPASELLKRIEEEKLNKKKGIKKIVEADAPKPTAKETFVATAVVPNIAPLLKRAFMFLEDGDWKSAEEYCEKVLDIDPENAEAYLFLSCGGYLYQRF